MAVSFLGLIIALLIIVVPVAVGIALIVRSRGKSLGYPACGKCQYNLTGTIGTETRCPECGAEFRDVGILPARAKRNPWLIGLGIALSALSLFFFVLAATSFFQAAQLRRQAAAQLQAVQANARANQARSQKAVQTAVGSIVPRRMLINGDERQLYFLIEQEQGLAVPADGWKLLVVFPGGGGGEDFLPFVTRIAQQAVSDDFIVAMAVAPKWREDENRIVWPTRGLPDDKMLFSTEEFAEAIVSDIAAQHPIDPTNVSALAWSSSGPAMYATLLQEQTQFDGAFIAMSVFKPEQLPPPENAGQRAFYLLHSPQDFIPIRFAETARDALSEAGARVTLQTYEGGHGWRGNVYGTIRAGIEWLVVPPEGDANESAESDPIQD